jgi:hypothetical protein
VCKFSKPWYIQKFNFYSKRNFLRILAHPAQPLPRRPAKPRRLPAPRSAHSAQAVLANLTKGVFSLTLRTAAETPSISHVTTMWGPPVSSIPFPCQRTVAASPCRLRPPRAAQLHPRMPPEPLLAPPSSPPPLISLLNTPPSSMALKPLTSPLLPSGHPSLALPQPL